jgi:hypothetical protein
VDQNVDTVGVWLEHRGEFCRPRHVTSEMGVAAAALFDPRADMLRCAVRARQADGVVAGAGEGRGYFGAETFGDAGDQ